MVKLSIIIPTLNEERDLPYLLNSIKKQDFQDYEIIVSDNDSKDKTKEIAKKFNCKIIKGGLPGEARNNGAKIAKGSYLLFLDADVILPTNFINNFLKEFKENKLDVAVCKYVPLSDKKIDALMYNFANQFIKTLERIKPMGAGYCILSKKDIHKKVNGFDEGLKLCEDHDYLYRISKIGKFRVIDKPRVFTSVRRFDKEGRTNLALKYTRYTLYYLSGKKIMKNEDLFNYEFGCFNDK